MCVDWAFSSTAEGHLFEELASLRTLIKPMSSKLEPMLGGYHKPSPTVISYEAYCQPYFHYVKLQHNDT
jgi:hypothetical protein